MLVDNIVDLTFSTARITWLCWCTWCWYTAFLFCMIGIHTIWIGMIMSVVTWYSTIVCLNGTQHKHNYTDLYLFCRTKHFLNIILAIYFRMNTVITEIIENTNVWNDQTFVLLTKILLSVVYVAFGPVHPQKHKHLPLGWHVPACV